MIQKQIQINVFAVKDKRMININKKRRNSISKTLVEQTYLTHITIMINGTYKQKSYELFLLVLHKS